MRTRSPRRVYSSSLAWRDLSEAKMARSESWSDSVACTRGKAIVDEEEEVLLIVVCESAVVVFVGVFDEGAMLMEESVYESL